MATVDNLLNIANKKGHGKKEENKNTITKKINLETEILDDKPGAVSEYSYRRDDEDSPTSLFTSESVESSAIQSVSRLMNMWEFQSQERDKNLLNPDDYVENANKIFSSYQGIRFKIDSAVAFLIGDILNECKAKFFNEDKKDGKKWLDFIKEKICFSQRQAYDFMSISSKLSFIRGKNLTMEQFRALLSLNSSGFEIHRIPENIEAMSPSSILELKSESEKLEKKITRSQALVSIVALISKLEKSVLEFDMLPMSTTQKMSEKEKATIFSLKQRLESTLQILDKNIPSS